MWTRDIRVTFTGKSTRELFVSRECTCASTTTLGQDVARATYRNASSGVSLSKRAATRVRCSTFASVSLFRINVHRRGRFLVRPAIARRRRGSDAEISEWSTITEISYEEQRLLPAPKRNDGEMRARSRGGVAS